MVFEISYSQRYLTGSVRCVQFLLAAFACPQPDSSEKFAMMEKKKCPVGPDYYTLYEEVGQRVSASMHHALCIPFNEIVTIKILDFERDNCDLNIRMEHKRWFWWIIVMYLSHTAPLLVITIYGL